MHRRVWRIQGSGDLRSLQLEDEEMSARPILPEGMDMVLRIEVKSVGLNFADIFACMGLYSATPSGAFVPGLEYAGEIIDIVVRADDSVVTSSSSYSSSSSSSTSSSTASASSASSFSSSEGI